MSVLEAAFKVLAESKAPLHSSELTQKMLDSKLWESRGITPWATVDARIAVDIKRNGAASRFMRVKPSTFALNPHIAAAPLPATKKVQIASDADEASVALSFNDAAEEVLQKYGQKYAMHYQKITELALQEGLIVTAGKTPEATMYAQILTEISRMEKRGERPRFVKHGKGLVSLSQDQHLDQGLAHQIDGHNKEIRKQLHTSLHAMPWGNFEALIGKLLAKLGFESMEVGRGRGDGGIDVRGILVIGDVIRTKMAVQAKRWSRNVQSPTVQQVRGSLGIHEQGLIITTSNFSSGAREESVAPNKTPIALMNGEELVNLLIEHNIGVRKTPHHLLELGEDEE